MSPTTGKRENGPHDCGLGPILDVLGATGETRGLAETFLRISSPSLPLLAAGMGCSGLLRSIGDARRAMNVTLFAALATAVVDPILIFGLHLGLPGAAISTVLSRLVLATLGWIGAAVRHKLVARPSFRAVAGDFAAIFHVAGPALLTNLATPVGAAYVTRSMAVFGPDAVAGQATIDRISPVAFGLIYALSGAVGPILAQNAGAGRLDRVRETLRDSSILVLATVLLAWAALALAQDLLMRAFVARGERQNSCICSVPGWPLDISSLARSSLPIRPSTISAIRCFRRRSIGVGPLSARSPSSLMAHILGQSACWWVRRQARSSSERWH